MTNSSLWKFPIPVQEFRRKFATTFSSASRSAALRDMRRGLGLGLSIVKDIVEAHGGLISIESNNGSGTRFVAQLPAFQEAA